MRKVMGRLFMRKYLYKAMYWFAATKAWEKIANKWIGKFTFRNFGYTKLADKMDLQFVIHDRMQCLIEEALVKEEYWLYAFVVADKESLAGKVIGGIAKQKYNHAGIFNWINDGSKVSDFLCHHMKGRGCVKQHFSNQMAQNDRFTIVRFKLDNKAEHDEAMRRMDFITKNRNRFKYDFQQKLQSVHDYRKDFDSDPKTKSDSFWMMYCSELVWFYIRGIVEHSRTEIILGRDAYGPDNVYKDGELVITIP